MLALNWNIWFGLFKVVLIIKIIFILELIFTLDVVFVFEVIQFEMAER